MQYRHVCEPILKHKHRHKPRRRFSRNRIRVEEQEEDCCRQEERPLLLLLPWWSWLIPLLCSANSQSYTANWRKPKRWKLSFFSSLLSARCVLSLLLSSALFYLGRLHLHRLVCLFVCVRQQRCTMSFFAVVTLVRKSLLLFLQRPRRLPCPLHLLQLLLVHPALIRHEEEADLRFHRLFSNLPLLNSLFHRPLLALLPREAPQALHRFLDLARLFRPSSPLLLRVL